MGLAVRTHLEDANFINEDSIRIYMENAAHADSAQARSVIAKAKEMKGLDFADVAILLTNDDPDVLDELFAAAQEIKEHIYGRRLVLFAPLYISNMCNNNCTYCAFRTENKHVRRRALKQEEIENEVRYLLRSGHKRLLLVAGESYPKEGLDYILRSIETIYAVKEGRGEIRRLNVNIAPLEVNEFKTLKAYGIGTYQLFQETYHRRTYKSVHLSGPKSNFQRRLGAVSKAFQGGIDDFGIGVLFGLFDYRFEVLALLQHIRHLEKCFGVGPHTISVPRLEPADGCEIASQPPYPVSDRDFKKIVAILRLTVPYTGIIMSTRETAKMRAATFALGVSQISAGSRTNPGGYGEGEPTSAQFQLGDHRSLDEVIADVISMGYIPSFCTACYRLGRTGEKFMELAKPGFIKRFCMPNALLTFKEYLEDYASITTRDASVNLIKENLQEIYSDKWRIEMHERLKRIEQGERDLYF